MSGYLAFRDDDSVSIFTDTAGFAPRDMTIAEFSPKFARIEGHDAVIVFRGSTFITNRVEAEILKLFSGFKSFDRAVDALIDVVKTVIRDGFMSLPDGIQRTLDFDCLIGGLRDDGTGGLYHFGSFDRASGRAFEMTEPVFILNGTVPEDGVPSAVTDTQAIAAMDAMRGIHHALGGGIGGALHRTDISASGVSTKCIHEWPDRIGERIQHHNVTLLNADIAARVKAIQAANSNARCA